MIPLIAPLIMARISSGLAIYQRVAPTICIVFIKKRLLNMARRIVLSIRIITVADINMAAINKKIVTILKLALIFCTTAVGYFTSSTIGNLERSVFISASFVESMYSAFNLKSMLG